MAEISYVKGYARSQQASPMKPRRWFLAPDLIQWRYMVACGNRFGPFFLFREALDCTQVGISPSARVILRTYPHDQ